MKMFNAIFAAVLVATVYTTAPVSAAPKEVEKELSEPQLQGKHTARFWGFKLFNAELWTSKPDKFSFDQQFALTLSYLYPFSKELLARSTVEEIARAEGSTPDKHAKLEKQLKNCLVDVDKGTRITGVAESANKVAMYVNGRKSCSINYPNLRKRFFGIWLAPTSRDARGVQRLRGAS